MAHFNGNTGTFQDRIILTMTPDGTLLATAPFIALTACNLMPLDCPSLASFADSSARVHSFSNSR